MPVSYTIEPARAHVRLAVAGELTFSEIHAAVTGIANDASLGDGFTVLADHRRIARPITPAQMSELVALVGEMHPRFDAVRWAIVVASGPSYGMMHLLAAEVGHSVNMKVGIFFDEPAAEKWLAEGDA